MIVRINDNNELHQAANTKTSITQPLPSDILCGKDKTYNKHPGNQVFRTMIGAWQEEYMAAGSKQAKMHITKQIVTTLQADHQARFLKLGPDSVWQEISNIMARDKVSHALRFAVSHKKSSFKSAQQHERPRSRPTTPKLVSPVTTTTTSLVDSLFYRQQAILGQELNQKMTIEAGSLLSSLVPPPNHVITPMAPQEEEEEHDAAFNTLRSEELDLILNEPLSENDLLEALTK